MTNLDRAISNLRQFADFCAQVSNIHPYIHDNEDDTNAQENCANDIYRVLDALEIRMKKKSKKLNYR